MAITQRQAVVALARIYAKAVEMGLVADERALPLSRQPRGKAPGVHDDASEENPPGAGLKAYEEHALEPAGNSVGEAGDSEVE